MGKIEIQIKHLSENSFKVEVEDQATVLELKKEIEKIKNIPAGEIKLIFKGKILKKDDDTLPDLKIEDKSNLHMVHAKPQTEQPTTQPNQQPQS